MNLTITPIRKNLQTTVNYQSQSNKTANSHPQMTSLSNFPKSYINISFKGNDDVIPRKANGIVKSEQEFSLEDKVKIQSRYLWGKNWNEEEARQRFYDAAENEISIKTNASLFGFIRNSTKMRIHENYRRKFYAEKLDAREARHLAYIYPLTTGTLNEIRALSAAENFKNSPTSLDANIAGYENEKKYLRQAFVDAMAAEYAGKDVKIPNGLILHGPTGCGKTAIARALAEETFCEVFDLPTSTEPPHFNKIISEQLNIAKQRYLDNGIRTIIIVNEMDKYLDADERNADNLAAMKGILDFCADKPDPEKKDGRFGTTFIFTTNHPAKIDTDLFLRPEKIEERIKLMPPEGKNFEAVLKHYIEIAKKTVDDEISKGREIKPISSALPYDKIAEKSKPSTTEGAYSCAKIKEIVETATRKYLDNDNDKEFITLLRQGILSKRDITPDKINTYNTELEQVQGKTLSRIEELSEARDLGIITHDELEELIYLEDVSKSDDIE